MCPGADNTSWWLNGSCPTVFFLNLKDNLSVSWYWRVSWYFDCRFIARPCAMGLKIQANGPQKAQPNAILEKVFTAITKVVHVSVSSSRNICASTVKASASHTWSVLYLVLASTQTRRGWRACLSSLTGTCGPSSAGSDNAATRRSPAPSPGSVKACKTKHFSATPHSVPDLATSHFSLDVIA